jgi:Fur family transcriptional regulator, ferric uptake regulator
MPARNTRQKAAIRTVFQEAARPLSTAEVLEKAQSAVEGLGIATVYRNVKALSEEGWLQVVELPGETARYEVAGKEHHHHFRCDACTRVFESDGCVPGMGEPTLGPGFKVRGHEIVFYGLCPDCTPRPHR